MILQKTITIFIEEEPKTASAGDLWIERTLHRSGYSIRKKTVQRWQYESEYLTAENLRDLYGVDIESLDRAHLIGG